MEPRIRVSALLRWEDRILLCRHEKGMREYWLLPGGGVNAGESLADALHRELNEEVGIDDELPLEGPVAIADSIAPERSFAAKHVVHIVFAGDLSGRSLEQVTSQDAAVRGHRLFSVHELDDVVLHPPIQRFLSRWQPGDPVVYLGRLWVP
jgi:8-oxo-dGTP diphosphatase